MSCVWQGTSQKVDHTPVGGRRSQPHPSHDCDGNRSLWLLSSQRTRCRCRSLDKLSRGWKPSYRTETQHKTFNSRSRVPLKKWRLKSPVSGYDWLSTCCCFISNQFLLMREKMFLCVRCFPNLCEIFYFFSESSFSHVDKNSPFAAEHGFLLHLPCFLCSEFRELTTLLVQHKLNIHATFGFEK